MGSIGHLACICTRALANMYTHLTWCTPPSTLVSCARSPPLPTEGFGIIAHADLCLGRDPVLTNQICQLLYDVGLKYRDTASVLQLRLDIYTLKTGRQQALQAVQCKFGHSNALLSTTTLTKVITIQWHKLAYAILPDHAFRRGVWCARLHALMYMLYWQNQTKDTIPHGQPICSKFPKLVEQKC